MRSATRLFTSIKKPCRQSLRIFSSIPRFQVESKDSAHAKSDPEQHEIQPRDSETDPRPHPKALRQNASNKFDSNIRLDLQPSTNAPSTRCHNRGVIITGGTSGIGLALTKRLVLESAGRVVLVTRNPTKAASTITQIKQETSSQTLPSPSSKPT